jgi:hypothetical protein
MNIFKQRTRKRTIQQTFSLGFDKQSLDTNERSLKMLLAAPVVGAVGFLGKMRKKNN